MYTYRLIGNSPPRHLPGAYPLSVDAQGTRCSHCALRIPQGQFGRLSYPPDGQCVGVHGLLLRTTGPLPAARPTPHPWQDCAPAHLPKLHRTCTPVMPPVARHYLLTPYIPLTCGLESLGMSFRHTIRPWPLIVKLRPFPYSPGGSGRWPARYSSSLVTSGLG